MGRKATGLNPAGAGYGSGAAGQIQHLLNRAEDRTVKFNLKGAAMSIRSNCCCRSTRKIFLFCVAVAAVFLPGPLRAADVNLAWNPSPDTDVTGYRLHYGTTSGVYSTKLEAGPTTSWKVTDLAPGLTYYFAATALNAAGIESAYSNQVSWSAPAADTQPPAAPAQLKAAAQATGASLTWSANNESDLAGYRVYYGTASGSYSGSVDAKKVTAFTVVGLEAGKTYYFALKAYDAAGNLSAYSNQASCAIPVPDTDGDGFIDTQDAFPNDPAEWKDADGDGIGDNADPDDNNDGIPDTGTAPPPNTPAAACSIWDKSATPAILSDPDAQAVELGLKFRAEVAGTVTGLRFYKSSANTGRHVGNLWTRDGRLLSSAAFANETASGWQEASFPAPVPVSAGATYVISYHTETGRYSVNEGYFSAGPILKSPLRALADGEDGPNGVYRYGASGFPTQSYNSSNYWVDVVFAAEAQANQSPEQPALASPAEDEIVGTTPVFGSAPSPIPTRATSMPRPAGRSSVNPTASASWTSRRRTP